MSDKVIAIGVLLLVQDTKGKSFIKFSSGHQFRSLNHKSQGGLLRECSLVMQEEANLTYPAPTEQPEDK